MTISPPACRGEAPEERGLAPRSRRIYVYWGVALAVLLTAGVLCWAVVPMLQVRAAVKRCADEEDLRSGFDAQARSEVETLGGAQRAHRRICQYLGVLKCFGSYRGNAIQMLGACGPVALSDLRELAKEEDEFVRMSVTDALGAIGGQQAVQLLFELVRDKEEWVRKSAIMALWDVRDPEGIEALAAGLQHDDELVRMAAVMALEKVGRPARVALETATEHEDEFVRDTATRALEEIKASR